MRGLTRKSMKMFAVLLVFLHTVDKTVKVADSIVEHVAHIVETLKPVVPRNAPDKVK